MVLDFLSSTVTNVSVVANQLVEEFLCQNVSSLRAKRHFYDQLINETRQLDTVPEVKELLTTSFELLVDRFVGELALLKDHNEKLLLQLAANTEQLANLTVVPDCYDPLWTDLFAIIADQAKKVKLLPNGTTTVENLTFKEWFNPQSAGITISAVLTALCCYLDARLSSYLSKKFNVPINGVFKVTTTTMFYLSTFCVSVCLSTALTFCPCVCLSVCLSTALTFCPLFVYLSVCLRLLHFVRMFVYLSVCLRLLHFVCLSVCLL